MPTIDLASVMQAELWKTPVISMRCGEEVQAWPTLMGSAG
jgi:hypothetical protein